MRNEVFSFDRPNFVQEWTPRPNLIHPKERKIVGKQNKSSWTHRPRDDMRKPSVWIDRNPAASRILEETQVVVIFASPNAPYLHLPLQLPQPTPDIFLLLQTDRPPIGSSTWTSFRRRGVCLSWRAVLSVWHAQIPPSLPHLSSPNILGSVVRQSSSSPPRPVDREVSHNFFCA